MKQSLANIVIFSLISIVALILNLWCKFAWFEYFIYGKTFSVHFNIISASYFLEIIPVLFVYTFFGYVAVRALKTNKPTRIGLLFGGTCALITLIWSRVYFAEGASLLDKISYYSQFFIPILGAFFGAQIAKKNNYMGRGDLR